MLQVVEANVLALRNLYEANWVTVSRALRAAAQVRMLGAPGRDPISRDYTPDLQARVDAVIALHEAERDELREVSDRLVEAAREYGHAEAEIAESFRRAHPHLARGPAYR